MNKDIQGLDLATIPTVLVAIIFPYCLGYFFGFEPPWPDEPGYIAGFLNALIIFFSLSNPPKTKRALSRAQRTTIYSAVVMIALYFTLYAFFVYEEPTSGSKIVSGFQCTSEATLIAANGGFAKQCPFLESEALAAAGYRAEVVWTATSIRGVQLAFIGVWVTFFALVTYGCAASYAFAQQAEKRRRSRRV